LDSRGLTENTEFIAHVPHNEVKQFQESSQVLLLLINDAPNAKGIVTGKLYEYLASLRPILAIGPEDGDAAKILAETNAGQTVSFDNKERMKEAIKDLYQRYLEDNLLPYKNKEIEKYSRKALAGEYGRLLDKLGNE
jgi:septum formation inhibitor-activating ATPase MinD